MWKTGKCKLPWDWDVDNLVFIEEGLSFICNMWLVYTKWFEADIWFSGFYQERYNFQAYGEE